MAKNYEQLPTFLGYSEEPLTAVAGGGLFGYGGVMLHKPSELESPRITSDPDGETLDALGVGFNYSEVATLTVSGILKWTNMYLERAPEGRQDISETGPIRIELFDEEATRQYIEEQSRLFEKLGIKFIH